MNTSTYDVILLILAYFFMQGQIRPLKRLAIIAETFGLSPFVRFMGTAIVHWILTIVVVKYYHLYSYSEQGWYGYYIRLLLYYIIMWNVVIYNLEKLI